MALTRPFGKKDARLLMSRINSCERKSIGTTPYKLAVAIFGKEFIDALGISYVESPEVKLTLPHSRPTDAFRRRVRRGGRDLERREAESNLANGITPPLSTRAERPDEEASDGEAKFTRA